MHPCFQLLKDNGFDMEHDLYVPIQFSTKTGQLSAKNWGIRLTRTKMTGKRKRIETATLTITYCPMCGEKIYEEPFPEQVKEGGDIETK